MDDAYFTHTISSSDKLSINNASLTKMQNEPFWIFFLFEKYPKNGYFTCLILGMDGNYFSVDNAYFACAASSSSDKHSANGASFSRTQVEPFWIFFFLKISREWLFCSPHI